MPTWLWLTSALASLPAGSPTVCATLRQLPGAPPLQRLPVHPPYGGIQRRELRDPFEVPHHALSEHFAVHWGEGGWVTETEVDQLLDALEHAWHVQIDQLGHPEPATSHQYYLNVYIGDSGDGAPASDGADGYYRSDADGFPMMVMAATTLNHPAKADHTAAHEFYHVIQDTLDRYPSSGSGAWFWEATAEWAAIHTDPTNAIGGSLAYAYALQPDRSLSYFASVGATDLQASYAYGAVLFALDLDRATGGTDLVRDAWLDDGFRPDPLDVIQQLLDDRELAFDDVFLDHIAAVTRWDYDQGERFAQGVSDAEARYPGTSTVYAVHGSGGTDGRIAVPGAAAPMRHGYAVIEVHLPRDGVWAVTLEAEPVGSEGTTSALVARVGVVESGVLTQHPLPMGAKGLVGEVEVDVQGADTVYLFVGAVPPDLDATRVDAERFPFTYALVPDGGEPSTEPSSTTAPDDDGQGATTDPTGARDGCGCHTAMGGITGEWLLLLGLIGRRRRAPPSSHRTGGPRPPPSARCRPPPA